MTPAGIPSSSGSITLFSRTEEHSLLYPGVNTKASSLTFQVHYWVLTLFLPALPPMKKSGFSSCALDLSLAAVTWPLLFKDCSLFSLL